MAKDSGLYNSVAPLKNVSALVALIDRVQRRPHGFPGLACYYGPSGFGKTTAGVYGANQFDAHLVQVKSVWTARKFCEAILADLSVKPQRTIADMVDQISDELARSGRPLLIDEADFLVQRKMVEIVRDIYESSGAAIVLIGEELLPQKLQAWERFHGRILDWVAAEPGSIDDVNHLAKIYCPGVELAEDLRQHLLQRSNLSIRRICVNLLRVHEVARTKGVDHFDMKGWGKTDFFTGSAPDPRRNLGGAAQRRRVV
ncbi:AAA domain-containing protein [Defluviimonas denitrificans]|jgi:DNA transposition AAA+ family ATPase|uniref:AAA domain-containing protein n=1 Tax=Albidovulum denitrificans TaxID=404881 RepID=A0A2S8S6F6_9RHOB|nr:AAA family ATPase [Defluviimonas denitrificans]PQV56372.1 AAA domain-containing protein [Defluviimonas denitrificans]